MKVGILGSGQLSRMMALEGARLGLSMSVYAQKPDDSAAQICSQIQLGALDDQASVQKFLRSVNIATFESEFINPELLKGYDHVFPRPELIGQIQDRLTQKELLACHKIPTSDFLAWNGDSDLSELGRRFSSGFVLKKRRFGYDGYGTFVFQKKDLGTKTLPAASREGYIAEEFIPFKRELAFSLARNRSGQFSVFPLVESKQVDSRCFWVKGPVKHRRFEALARQFKKLLKKIDYVGILAVELFDTGSELLVNELAPRVHNSAHYSLDALNLNQFEAHLRAVLDWPLKDPTLLSKGFAMVNLLGEGGADVLLSQKVSGKLHWYAKGENRRGRKLGHITCLNSSPELALKQALLWRKDFHL